MMMSSERGGGGGECLRADHNGATARAACVTRSSLLAARSFRPALTLIELLIVIIILSMLVSAAIPIMAPTNDDRRIREASRMVNTYITGAQMKAVETQRPYGVMIKRLSQNTNPDGPSAASHDDNAVSIELQYVEQPPPFVGFSESSAARVALYEPTNSNLYGRVRPLVRIQFVMRGNANPKSDDGLPVGWDADALPDATIRPGDLIEINGTRYELMVDANDTGTGGIAPRFDSTGHFFARDTGANDADGAPQVAARPINDSGQLLYVTHDDRGDEIGTTGANSAPFFTNPASYKILRQPMPSSADPLQLADGTAIDLRASGVGTSEYFYVPRVEATPSDFRDNREPIVIMFAPEGRVSRVRFAKNVSTDADDPLELFDEPVVDNIYLMVGRRELAPPPIAADDISIRKTVLPPSNSQEYEEIRNAINWLRGESRWIGIGALSGRVVTVQNNAPGPRPIANDPDWNDSNAPAIKRNFQIHTARELARQMSQLGGR